LHTRKLPQRLVRKSTMATVDRSMS
jgi:hypothetical protein